MNEAPHVYLGCAVNYLGAARIALAQAERTGSRQSLADAAEMLDSAEGELRLLKFSSPGHGTRGEPAGGAPDAALHETAGAGGHFA